MTEQRTHTHTHTHTQSGGQKKSLKPLGFLAGSENATNKDNSRRKAHRLFIYFYLFIFYTDYLT